MSRKVKVPFHIQILPRYGTENGVTTVTSASVVGFSGDDKPRIERPGSLLVKLTIEVDEQHLLQAGGRR